MYRILLVCTGNTCRSPMLEALIKAKVKALGKALEVKSAGLYVTDEKVSPLARAALKGYGAVIRHKPTQLVPKALERADTVITMTEQQKSRLYGDKCYYKVFSLREAAGQDCSDPYGGDLEEYKRCAAELDKDAEIIVRNLISAGKI